MKILVIDDEKSIRFSLKTSLSKQGYQVYDAETGEEGLKLFKKHEPEIAIVDIKLPGIDGIEVLRRIKSSNRNCIVIMITYLSEIRLAVKAMKIGAYDYYTKPFTLKEINASVSNACKYLETKKRLDKMTYKTDLIGKSLAIKDIKDRAKKIASLNMETSVLIQGESGTGKEIVAKLIHQGKGMDKPFVALNCAAVPKNLQESELFGYEKGAFTGAEEKKIGLIEKSNGGILFLDEVGDMDLGLQAKMLRVLQESKYRPIGGIEEGDFKSTIIAATNKDLKLEIENENFREDLYYRLNIVPLYIPPLRHRKEDIPMLIDYFLEEYNFKLGKNILGFDDKAMDIMINYNWLGNVRELKNIIERICIFQEEDIIKVENLPKDLVEETKTINKNLNPLEASERETILQVLNEKAWNISKSAEVLEMSRSTLRRKIEKYELQE